MKQANYILLFFLFGVANAFGQNSPAEPKSNPIKKFLGNFTVSGSIGYGATFHKHEITGVGLIQNPGTTPYIFDNSVDSVYQIGDSISMGFNNWVNNPTGVGKVGVDSSSFLLGTDTVPVTFKALGTNIPLTLSIHYTFDRYRIGGGFTFEPYFIGKYKPNVHEQSIATFKTNFSLSSYTRWFFLFGGEIFRTKRYMLVGDAMIGSYKLQKKHYNPDIIKKGIFFNFGVRMEHSLSEYVKVFIRPAFEFKSYTLTFPESNFSTTHNLPAFYTTFGVSWRLPDRNKCPISSCHTQINHQHGGKAYRSRRHPFWKWQDPDYGQNYPKLIKYKGKNKKKISPY